MIHVENLTKYFDDFCAVDQISFEIQKGEILGLLGPNGAGKTTTLRMLTGFLRPSSGNIRVKDYSIDEHGLEIKSLLGYLPESAPLYHDMLVFDYLDYVANIRDIKSDAKITRLKQLADLCGINEVMHKPINQLSKGYKQRVGLAHAMMNDPEILVLDEPTSGLDPNQIVEIRDIIKEIGKTKTIIISTHILSEVEATCGRVVILNQGKIAADSTTEALRQGAGGEYFINITLLDADIDSVRAALGSIGQILAVEEEKKADDNDALHIRLRLRSPSDIRPEIYRKIKQSDWTLLEFQQETLSLESIFRQLTKEN
ncbi:ABC transporter ATP-binding protein [uncultured Desulfobacterium sp.]|uniref:ABC transporter ATP-binding protein n=1 Tax=uncultured Desulfobacterium sp. TaxID=201089 RepID=A0A445MWL6_9BACT|nr:ABC transporter ATP-binding protein [uncultured Desulfobacterium sp.]